MKLLGVYQIPSYAVTAIEYGDTSGISAEDEHNIEAWIEAEFNDIVGQYPLYFDWNNGISEEESGEVNECYFSSNPAFGLACDVIDCAVYYH